jgi:hypothetical protein
MNLMSSTLLLEDTDVPFDQLQAEQIALFRVAWAKAGHDREPRVSVSRSVIPITSDLDRQLFGEDANEDQVGWLDGAISRFGRSYTGEPDRIAKELARDEAVRAADTLLLTVPSQLGVEYNAALLDTIAHEIAPAIGWSPKMSDSPAAYSSRDGSDGTRTRDLQVAGQRVSCGSSVAGVGHRYELRLYARLVRMTLFRMRTPAAIQGAMSEATRDGRPEFQGVATNHPTRGSVPRATAEACHRDWDAATKNAAAPSSTNDPSPIETPRSPPCRARIV